jgi:hypothetical protein
MLKKLRVYFGSNLESESMANKRVKQKQQALATRLKQNLIYQQAVLTRTKAVHNRRVDQLNLG